MKKIFYISVFLFLSILSQAQINIISDNTWKGVGNSTLSGGNAWLLQGYNDTSWPVVEAPNAGNTIPVVGGSQSMWVLPYSDTAMMRKTFIAPVGDSYTGSISINADNEFTLYFNGLVQGSFNNWQAGPFTFNISPALQGCVQNVIAVHAANWGGPYGASLNADITVVNPLNTPIAQAATNVACDGFTANWDSVTTGETYLLDVSTDPNFGTFFSVYQNNNVGNVLNQNIPGIVNGTTYYYRLRVVRGNLTSCYSNVITVIPPVVTATASSNSPVCPGLSIQLNGNTLPGSPTYSWTGPNGFSSNLQNPVINNASISDTGTYSLTIISNACTSSVSNVQVIVNNLNLQASNDTSVCPGSCANLSVSGADFYSWSPSTGLSDTASANPTACVSQNTTYTVTGYVNGQSVVTNGDFSGGNSGFSSSYTFSSDTQPESTYFVTTNANLTHPGFSGFDHTTGSGNFMVVNGAGTPNTSVWCQTITVTPNTDYIFSTWVSSVALGSPALLQFNINGTPLGSTFQAPSTTGVWQEFYTTWNSGSQTSVTICIINQNTTLTGNDFGIDDIFFAPVCQTTEQVVVNVNTVPTSTFTVSPTALCSGQNTTITYTGNANTNANYTWNFNGGTVVSGSGQGPYVVNWSTSGSHPITLTVTQNGCSSAQTTNSVNVNPTPTANFTIPTTLCLGQNTSVTYTGSGSGSANYSWNFNGANIVSGSGPGPYSLNWTSPGSYNVTLTVTENGCVSTQQTASITVFPVPQSGFTLSDNDICTGEDITVSYTGTVITGANYNWDWQGGNVSGNDPGPYTLNFTNDGTYNLSLTVSAGPCTSLVSTLPLVVHPIPSSNFTINLPPCTGYNGTINYTGTGTSSANYNWNFNGATINSGSGQGPYDLTWNNAGTYNVTLTVIENACTSSVSSQAIVASNAPDASFTYQELCFQTVDFTNTSTANENGNFNSAWNFGDSQTGTETSLSHSYANGGSFDVWLTVTNALGCKDSTLQSISVKPSVTFSGAFLPNIITPNGDLLNDVFELIPDFEDCLDYELIIYNRWGQKVYNGSKGIQIFNGKTNFGTQVSDGVYFYIIKVGTESRNETLTVVRK